MIRLCEFAVLDIRTKTVYSFFDSTALHRSSRSNPVNSKTRYWVECTHINTARTPAVGGTCPMTSSLGATIGLNNTIIDGTLITIGAPPLLMTSNEFMRTAFGWQLTTNSMRIRQGSVVAPVACCYWLRCSRGRVTLMNDVRDPQFLRSSLGYSENNRGQESVYLSEISCFSYDNVWFYRRFDNRLNI